MRNKQPDVEISVEVRAKTPKAWLCYDGRVPVWVPVSQIKDYCEDPDGSISSIFLSEWMATEKGFL